MDKILFIVGPTATGKTDLGIALAKKFDGEIISADSRQVYRYMDIGTGKDLSFPQWGLDLCDPDYDFNVSEYRRYAVGKIKELQKRAKLPIVVGGTGFYVKALLAPWETMDIKPNQQLRDKLLNCSTAQLQERLKKINPKKLASMNESDRQNSRRLIRAIETSSHIGQGLGLQGFALQSLIIGLTAPYKFLYERIDRRVDKRIEIGMAEELEKLKKFKKLPKTLGYNGETPQGWKFAEHAYARRQMGFFKNLGKKFNINWFDITAQNYPAQVEKLVGNWYN